MQILKGYIANRYNLARAKPDLQWHIVNVFHHAGVLKRFASLKSLMDFLLLHHSMCRPKLQELPLSDDI